MTARKITVVGGGLAGLGLGICLRKLGIDTEVHEALDYPRHKVCGEFITGLDPLTIESLEIGDLMIDAVQHTDIAWFRRNKHLHTWKLPHPAYGISRWSLDARLAENFRRLGGRLTVNSRFRLNPEQIRKGTPDVVLATGRHRSKAIRSGDPRQLIGLKAHVTSMPLKADLEMHLGRRAYVGVSGIEGDKVNICGLFQRRDVVNKEQGRVLECTLRNVGLSQLSDRMERAEVDTGSRCGVAALNFQRDANDRSLRVGDSRSAITPLSGHGIAIAMNAAHPVAKILKRYVSGEIGWASACIEAQCAQDYLLRHCIRGSRVLQKTVLFEPSQWVISSLARLRLLPFNLLYKATHSA